MVVIHYVAFAVYIVAALLMIGAILLQEGKGGGLSALGGTQAESAFGASNPVRRMTVVLAVIFFLLAGILSYASRRGTVDVEKGASTSAEKTDDAKTEDAAEGDTTSADTASEDTDAADSGAETDAPATETGEPGTPPPSPEEAAPEVPPAAGDGE